MLIKWFFKMWPVLIPAVMAGVHYLIGTNGYIDLTHTNNVISLMLQVIGGILILYSIDSNLGIMNNSSLLLVFSLYIKSFPLLKRSVTINLEPISCKTTFYPVKIRTGSPTTTTEEKIKYLQQQIDWLKEDFNDKQKHLKKMISGVEKEANTGISEIKGPIQSIDNKVKDISVGGIKTQIFGVLLMIHGSVSSYYA